MASGMGVRGTVGRCYGFFADFKACQVEVSERIIAGEKEMPNCGDMREDYFECLHSKKERARWNAVIQEKKKQEYEAKHGPSH